MLEMILRRLTKTQKTEILEAYRSGQSTNLIAKNYDCTPNTINRTVKSLLSETEYTLLKKNRVNLSKKNEKIFNNKSFKEHKKDFQDKNLFTSSNQKVKEEDLSVKHNEFNHSSEFEEIAPLTHFSTNALVGNSNSEDISNKDHDLGENIQNFDNNFEEIEPLASSFEFDSENQKEDFKILKQESLPECVYMIVDKKVELDLQPISALPEWSFLPENELKRNAILLFSNQRSAKRSCSKNQRVIKIPNTRIFLLSKQYLISKGITRLILEDSIIGLDN